MQGPRGRNKLEESGGGRVGDVGRRTCRPGEELRFCYPGGRRALKVVSCAVVWSGSPNGHSGCCAEGERREGH